MLAIWVGLGCSLMASSLHRRAETVRRGAWNRVDLTEQPAARERLEREGGALSVRARDSGIVAAVGGAILLLGMIFNALVPWANLIRKRRAATRESCGRTNGTARETN
jgi:hypothetical protein